MQVLVGLVHVWQWLYTSYRLVPHLLARLLRTVAAIPIRVRAGAGWRQGRETAAFVTVFGAVSHTYSMLVGNVDGSSIISNTVIVPLGSRTAYMDISTPDPKSTPTIT